MKHFRLIDNVAGWLTFLVAAFVYCSTIEPTASFWDCPEFITTAYKLEVGHPPGAPFFMLTGNLFTQFVNDPTQVAYMVNMMSALMSAACILFLFWSITHLARKLLGTGGQLTSMGQLIAVEVSGLVGALAYTFSDTFWFSAVEGEVYAYSSLFTALVFWLILKWEDHADEPHSDRWLVLIAYLTGLSIGVHLLNLLCLPAIVLVFYYRKYPNANLKGSIMALLCSFVLIAVVLYGIVPGIVKVGGWFELLFVNQMHLPFNTGLIIYILLAITAVLWAIWETHREQQNRTRMIVSYALSVGLLGIPFYGYGWRSVLIGVVALGALVIVLRWRNEEKFLVSARIMNTSLLCMLMIMVGYSSYAVIVIRSTANTPMDQNSPEDIFTLGTYLSREQYGDRPLFYGPSYNSQVEFQVNGDYWEPVKTEGAPIYQRREKKNADEKDNYELVRYNFDYKYGQNMLFPRMYSDRHKQAYEDWMGGVKGRIVEAEVAGRKQQIKMPTMLENLRFFFSYQMNFMYWRYFMWNFAGRQNDIQGNGELEHGNWLTGIKWFDNMRLGDQSKLPTELRENKGHNVFYALPLLLGLLGLFWQVYKNPRGNALGTAAERGNALGTAAERGKTLGTAAERGNALGTTAERGNALGTTVDEGVKQFWVVFFLFFMTGIAIVIYLNQTPQQPRERDYAYAGSFYAYAIWIGLGVAAVADWLSRLTKNEMFAALVSCLFVLVPIQMASQTWDDHDRSGRYTCRDFGHNYLQSLQQTGNPIIFTNGDNDTFPLWYAQETEGFRTDARVCNLSYLQTDWYIDQMRRPAYDSPSLPISWKRIDYVSGKHEAVRVYPGTLEGVIEQLRSANYSDEDIQLVFNGNPFDLKNIIDSWVLDLNPEVREIKKIYGMEEAFIPTDSLVLTIDKEAVKRSGMMIAADSIPDVMHISLKNRGNIYKSELMMLEMLARANWERPMYVAVTVGRDNYGDLGKNFVREGLVDRITPFDTEKSGRTMDSEKLYDNLMNKFRFGGLDNPDIYLDETVMRMCNTHRRLFAQLGLQLMREGKKEKALLLMEKAEKEIPATTVPHSWMGGSLDIARVWITLDKAAKGEAIAADVAQTACEYLDWYMGLSKQFVKVSSYDIRSNFYTLQEAVELLQAAHSKQADPYEKALDAYYSQMSYLMR